MYSSSIRIKIPWIKTLVLEKEDKVYNKIDLKNKLQTLLTSEVTTKGLDKNRYIQQHYSKLYLDGLLEGHIEDPTNLPYYILLKEITIKDKKKNKKIDLLYKEELILFLIMFQKNPIGFFDLIVKDNNHHDTIIKYLTLYYYLEKNYGILEDDCVMVKTPNELHLYLNIFSKHNLSYKIAETLKKTSKDYKKSLVFCTENNHQTIDSSCKKNRFLFLNEVITVFPNYKHLAVNNNLCRKYYCFYMTYLDYLIQYSKIVQFFITYSTENILMQSIIFSSVKNIFKDEHFFTYEKDKIQTEKNMMERLFFEYSTKYHISVRKKIKKKNIYKKQLLCLYYVNKIHNTQLSCGNATIRFFAITLGNFIISSLDIQKTEITNYRIYKNEYIAYIKKEQQNFNSLLKKYLSCFFYFII